MSANLPRALHSPEALREHLHIAAGHAPPAPPGDQGYARQGGRKQPAAVLVGIVERADGLQIILTQRAAHLKSHAGQISFPGGRMETTDANAAAAALREANEEIGLDASCVDVLGGLRSYDTITGFRVHPVVGWITDPGDYVLDPSEVDEAFEVPLSFLIDPANHRRDSYMRGNERRHYFVIPYRQRYIWGATAGMLVGFSRLLHAPVPGVRADEQGNEPE